MRATTELEQGEEELNLTPYLDLMLNLMVFLMVGAVAAGELSVVQADPPAVCATCPGGGGAALSLVLDLRPDAVWIREAGGQIPAERLAWPSDPDDLSAALARWKRTWGLGEAVTVQATAELPYQQVVTALDAARSYEGQDLFPSPRLARAQGGG